MTKTNTKQQLVIPKVGSVWKVKKELESSFLAEYYILIINRGDIRGEPNENNTYRVFSDPMWAGLAEVTVYWLNHWFDCVYDGG